MKTLPKIALAASLLLTACGHPLTTSAPRQATSSSLAARSFDTGLVIMGVTETHSETEFGAEQIFTLSVTSHNQPQTWKVDATQSQHTRLDHGFVTFTIDGKVQADAAKATAADALGHGTFGSRAVQLTLVQGAEDALLHGDWSGSPSN